MCKRSPNYSITLQSSVHLRKISQFQFGRRRNASRPRSKAFQISVGFSADGRGSTRGVSNCLRCMEHWARSCPNWPDKECISYGIDHQAGLHSIIISLGFNCKTIEFKASFRRSGPWSDQSHVGSRHGLLVHSSPF